MDNFDPLNRGESDKKLQSAYRPFSVLVEIAGDLFGHPSNSQAHQCLLI